MCEEIKIIEATAELPEKKKKNKFVILITIIATVVFVAVTICSVFVFKNYIFDILSKGKILEDFKEFPTEPNIPYDESFPMFTPDEETTEGDIYVDIEDLPEATLEITSLDEDRKELTASEIYKKVSPSVVVVVGLSNSGTTIGTGVIMTEDGYIITNEHIVDKAKTLYILTFDDLYYSAKIVNLDSDSDLALLKVEATDLVAAEFGDSDEVIIGEGVVSIGTPYSIDYAYTITDGIISGIRSDVYVNNRKIELLQTNAQLNPGNSGGPLINLYGQVIGINRSKIMTDGVDTYEGMGFSIPSNHVQTIINGFLTGEEAVGYPTMGLSIVYLDEETAKLNQVVSGAYIVSVDVDSSSYKCGLRPGDVIMEINGKSFTSNAGFIEEKDKFKPGDKIEVTYWSAGKTKTISVELMEDMT